MRSHLPWQWFVFPIALVALSLGIVGWMVAQRNEAGALGQEMERVHQQLVVQREELNVLRSTAGTGQNAVSIERASQQQLLGRIKELESQNAALKEDILLFERLIPVAGEGAVIRIENFRVFQEAPGSFRYRLLFAFQPDKQTPDFRGRLQLVVDFGLSGKRVQMLLPDRRESFAEYQVELKHFLRREGGFKLPEGAVVLGVEARVLQGDTLKHKRLAQL